MLIQKLDQFIRKFYINQLIRGVLYSVGLILLLFLAVSLLESQYYFSTSVRKTMFFSFMGISLLALGGWVLLPLTRYFRLGSVISHEQAAQIIGEHFTGVKDKLLNVLQLRQQSEDAANRELILASINQKSEEIKVVPFRNAIDLSKNRRYLKYALPPLLLLLAILLINASLITDSTNRLIKNNTEFEPPAPFSFVLDNENPSVVQFQNYPLTVNIEGQQLPNEVFITIEKTQYRLKKEAPNRFSYTFNNVQKPVDFRLYSAGVTSKDYELNVLMKPNVAAFEVKLDYPAYTQRNDEELANIGDLTIPAGTQVDWVFDTENTDNIRIQFSDQDEPVEIKRFSDDLFTFKKRMMGDAAYKLYISNSALPNADSISYAISVIPDLYPTIEVERFQDSTDKKLAYFVGSASDDYGLRRLSFNYRIKTEQGQGQLQTVPLGAVSGKEARFDHVFDIQELALKPGEEVSYYFEIFDNDAVNGSKSARTNLMLYAMPTVEEFKEMEEQNDDEIKKDLEEALKESKKIQDEMKKMREKLLQEKEMDWQSRKELEKLLDRQKELEKQIEQAKENFEENQENRKEFTEQDERLQEKQEQLQKMMEEVMSEEMKELMKQIEELLQEMNKEEALEKMEEMELSDEQLEMELDRMLEMFKQLELEQEMTETIDELKELAKEQEELSEETEEGETDQEELQEKQEEIEEKLEDLKEKMEEMQEKNKELENPMEMPNREEQMEDIQEDIQESQEQMEQQENQKASQSQKSAAQKMQDMAEAMEMMMQSGEMEQMEEDMKALRQLLENIVGLSFGQEDLMDEFDVTETNTPRYVELVQRQFKLKDDFRLVEDSLHALSKRVIQIETFVTEKVGDIRNDMRKSLKELEERRKPQAANHQQRSMKNLNDLALMLSEVMDQMQQQMSGMMAGNQMCNKPGGKGSSGKVPKDMPSQGQESLQEQMKGLKQRMEQGKGSPSSKEFAQMAARQAALRKAMKEKQQELKEKGKGSKELEDIIDGMDKMEEDLVNKRLTNEMLKRQQDIVTRLLEHENAERQREYDQQRKAERASEQQRRMPPSLEEYIKKREAEIDLYKTVSPALKPYYKSLVEDYFKSLEGE